MTKIKTLSVDSIQPNHHRMLDSYPWNEKKVETLQHSIEDIGMWESIIARETETGYEMAFGHHRLEAAKRSGLTEIPVIVKPLTDEQMLQYMGRENGEDYSTDYLVMLNTWDGAVEFLARAPVKSKPIDIARLLGWTRMQDSVDVMNGVAKACNAGHSLISAGYLGREDLTGLSVHNAESIVVRAQARMEALEKAGAKQHVPKAQTEQAKKHIAKGAKQTAKEVNAGDVKSKDVRAQVDVNAFKAAAESKAKNRTPLFSMFAKNLASGLERMLNDDAATEKLSEIQKALTMIQMDEDLQLVNRVNYELGAIADRAGMWQKRMVTTDQKVTKLKGIK